MQKTKNQIALELLAPYYHNPDLCGMEDGECCYRTDDGKMCVAGKCFNEDIVSNLSTSEKSESILRVIKRYKEEKLFKQDFVGIFTSSDWYYMQRIHDSIAVGENFTEFITKLNLFTMEELQNEGKNNS